MATTTISSQQGTLSPKTIEETPHDAQDNAPTSPACVRSDSSDFYERIKSWTYRDRTTKPTDEEIRIAIDQSLSSSGGFPLTVSFIGGHFTLSITTEDFKKLSVPFFPDPQNSNEERRAIAQAVALFEREILPRAFITNDAGGWRGNSVFSCPQNRQQDCFNEQETLYGFLYALQQKDFLKFHTLFGLAENNNKNHHANMILDLKTAEAWIVDSWVNNQGEEPWIGLQSEWKKKTWLEGN